MEVDTQLFNIINVVRVFVVATISFFVAVVVTPLWLRFLKKYKLGKQIRTEGAPVYSSMHKKKEGTPTMGGFLIWTVVLVLAVGFLILHNVYDGFWSKFNFLSRGETLLPLGAMVIAGLIGMLDDLMGIFKVGPSGGGLSMKYRILLFALVAAGGSWWFQTRLDWDLINIPFLGDFNIGLWFIPLSFFIIFATSFSANETDGLDGLVGGVFLTAFAAYGGIAFVQGKMDLAVFNAAIIGALAAFLWFNIYPAKFFMGDTGSMSLGVALGVIAMLTNAVFLLPIIGIIFVIESLSVIVQLTSKKLRGKKVFISTPIHHHFEAKKWHETQITMRFWMISALGAIIGLIIFLVDSKLPPFFR
jgi:phospho-N-acetylmuramoyl-pentapeptide-transferase